MITLILTILIVYIGWLVIRPWIAGYMRRKFQERVERMFRDAAFGSGGGRGRSPFGTNHSNQAPRQPRRRKIFASDEGEYIEFQEITVETTYTTTETSTTTGTDGPRSHTPAEPRISDADWEEIS